MKTLKVGKFQ